MKKTAAALSLFILLVSFMTACGNSPLDVNEPENTSEKQEQAVMVNDRLYFNTHQVITFLRCGVMDGSITSRVSEYALPSENNQSNFGTGYEYQLVDDNHIDIPMDNPEGWIRFCTGECQNRHEEDLCGVPKVSQPCIFIKHFYSVTDIFTGESCLISEDDGIKIAGLLEKGNWSNGSTADCINNIELVLNGETYYYHSDCGTFNDSANSRSLTLDLSEKDAMNELLKEYISFE